MSSISPDGKTVALDRRDSQTGLMDIWTYSLVRGTNSRLTFNSTTNQFPLWSPDGRYIAFTAFNKDRSSVIYKKASNGIGPDEALDKGAGVKIAYDWSRDGQYIIEGVVDPKTKEDIWVLPISPQGGEPKDLSVYADRVQREECPAFTGWAMAGLCV